jgi:hypothetical protein
VVDGADNTAPQISVTNYRISYTEARQRGAEAVVSICPSYILLYIAHQYAKHFANSKADSEYHVSLMASALDFVNYARG